MMISAKVRLRRTVMSLLQRQQMRGKKIAACKKDNKQIEARLSKTLGRDLHPLIKWIYMPVKEKVLEE